MHLLAPSPKPMNASLRSQSLGRRASAANFTGSSARSRSQAQPSRFGSPEWSSRLSEGASRQQPMRRQRFCQPCTRIKVNLALRASCFRLLVLWRLTEVQSSCGLFAHQVARLGSGSRSARSGTAWPNPSLKLSPNSKSPGPRYSAVHHLQRGPGVSLPVPA
jgi:hypothetical protein